MKEQTLIQYFGIGFGLIFLEIPMSIVWVADWIGGGWTLFVMTVSFISPGIFMLRHHRHFDALLAGAAVRNSHKHFPLSNAVADSLYCRRAVFLLSPGFNSAAVALLLLIPFKGNDRFFTQSFQSRQTYSSAKMMNIIEGEYMVTLVTSKADKPQKISNLNLIDDFLHKGRLN